MQAIRAMVISAGTGGAARATGRDRHFLQRRVLMSLLSLTAIVYVSFVLGIKSSMLQLDFSFVGIGRAEFVVPEGSHRAEHWVEWGEKDSGVAVKLPNEAPVVRRLRYLRRIQSSNTTPVVAFEGHHDLGVALVRKDGSRSALYVLIPKGGSSFIRGIFAKSNATSGGKSILRDAVRLSHMETQGLRLDDDRTYRMSDFLTFTILRDPRERIVSAYSTIIARSRGMYPEGLIGHCRGETLKVVSPPIPNTLELQHWKSHFEVTLEHWMENIRTYGWNGRTFDRCKWNVHLIPQVEYLRGYDLSHIGCLDSIDETLEVLNLTLTHELRKSLHKNRYEHHKFMPREKFQAYDMLSPRTKSTLKQMYREDFELYDAFCGGNRTKATNGGRKFARNRTITQAAHEEKKFRRNETILLYVGRPD